MLPTEDVRRGAARERWFWVGVGFVSALAILLLGLFFTASLTARNAPRTVVRHPAPPSALPRVESPVVELPPPPAPPPDAHSQPPDRPAADAPSRRGIGTPAKPPEPKPAPSPPVRIVERPRSPRQPAATGQRAPAATDRSTRPSSDPAAAGVRVPGGSPADSGPVDRVSGAREEWVDLSPGRAPARPAPGPRQTGRRSAPAAEGRDTVPPRLLTGRDAEYPLGAIQDGVTGNVILKVVVDPEGYVERAIVVDSSGDARLDAAAVRAVLTWRYRPATRRGQPVPGTDQVTIEFFRDGSR